MTESNEDLIDVLISEHKDFFFFKNKNKIEYHNKTKIKIKYMCILFREYFSLLTRKKNIRIFYV